MTARYLFWAFVLAVVAVSTVAAALYLVLDRLADAGVIR